jgi:hypothetical protein
MVKFNSVYIETFVTISVNDTDLDYRCKEYFMLKNSNMVFILSLTGIDHMLDHFYRSIILLLLKSFR